MDDKKDTNKDIKSDGDEDLRLKFLQNYITKSLKIKTEKWVKMITTDEYAKLILNFFANPDIPRLVILTNPTGFLQPITELPKNLKTKSCYFIRKKKDAVTAKNVREILTFGDMSSKPVDELAVLVEEVIVPILTNTANQCEWPKMISDDIIKQLHTFKSNVYQMKGALCNQTLLPMPIGIKEIVDVESILSDGTQTDVKLKGSIESCIVQWASICGNFLKQSSKAAFVGGINPTPAAEIEFWNMRLKNLESIYSQLRDPKVKKMILYLEVTKSKYINCFKDIFQRIIGGVLEARDVCTYLRAIKPNFDRFENHDFMENESYIRPLAHCLGLLWGNSRYYCSNARMTILLKEVANLLIFASTNKLNPNAIFLGERVDMWQKVKKCIYLLELFQTTLEEVRANILSYFKSDNMEPKVWAFQMRDVFQRLADYLDRLRLINSILETAIEYEKLEKIEIGGIKGRILSPKVKQISDEFNAAYNHLSNIEYNILKPEEIRIVKENKAFMRKCTDFDNRLAAIFEQTYDDCCSMQSIFQLINMASTVIQRPLIDAALRQKYNKIITFFNQELDTVKVMYEEGIKIGITIDQYFPPVAGKVWWLEMLKQRILKPGEDFKFFNALIIQCKDAACAFQKWDRMLNILKEDQEKIVLQWLENIQNVINKSLQKTQLILLNDSLHLNFDSKLAETLREVKYLRMLQVTEIDSRALELFDRNEELHRSLLMLYRIIEWYNYIKLDILPVEYALIQRQVNRIDVNLQELIRSLTWETDNSSTIKAIYNDLQKLYNRVLQAKTNITELLEEIQCWSDEPLFTRKDGNKTALLQIENRIERINRRYSIISVTSEKAQQTVNSNHNLFFNISDLLEENVATQEQIPNERKLESNVSETKLLDKPVQTELEWTAYVYHIDSLISNKIIEAAINSFKVFIIEMDPQHKLDPLFEIVLELRGQHIEYIPSVFKDEPDNFLQLLKGLLEDIINMGKHIKRVLCYLNTAEEEHNSNYYIDIIENEEIKLMRCDIMSLVSNGLEEAIDYIESFNEYAFLWLEDSNGFLNQFLLHGRQLTIEEQVLLQEDGAFEIEETLPNIGQFREQIDFYEGLYKKVEKIEMVKIVSCWLRIDVGPLRQAILNYASKWGNLLKQHLFDYVFNSINELELLISGAIVSMQVKLTEDNYNGLLNVMRYLSIVKDRQDTTDNVLQHLTEIIDLLRDYEVEFSEEVLVRLQELPEKWIYCKKIAVNTKHTVSPLQIKQVNAIRKRIALFEEYQAKHHDTFKKMAFFKWGCENVYNALDQANRQITALEKEHVQISRQAVLFEVYFGECKQLKASRKELRQLKHLWDFVHIVLSNIDEWKTTPWKEIDVEGMEAVLKKFGKEVRQMDKKIRCWDVYIKIKSTIKNMSTSLRAVTELQNSAIKERHWIELMQATKVKLVMDDSTTLDELLSLNLHEYEDEVKTIVDKSVKEMAMEKMLKELNQTWLEMEFETDTHDRTQLTLLKASEEIIEILEDNQVQLQNMLTSKFIEFFRTEVSEWQVSLSNADQVIQIFFEVQRKWCYLESIFIGSEDIRNQLPNESQKFDGLDRDFKSVLSEMVATLNVIKATNKSGLYGSLHSLLAKLLLCEKALNDYLETKRLAFPRFYFVSSADLLDILSNGNQPKLVARHLTKLFDSLAKLRFMEGSKKANLMGSKENDEWVPFIQHCECSGKVEVWLNSLIDIMRKTLLNLFGEAIITYSGKPRDVWLFNYPAQPALCVTQIWWTIEVNMSFGRLEEGYENALKDYQKKQINQLNALIVLLFGNLTSGDRQKIMTICTIDVHSRDVVANIIQAKVENSQAFQWQSQLRHRWDTKLNDCFINICDAQFKYQYEYLGNTPRLVITPLTDRCYITLTQSLHLVMGGAPAGPAGTGKTETTKDLGKGLGVMVYVFNCSEQMDYKSVGNIYKGLTQTGTWGCFDEFNRISVEVLSVVAVQVETIQNAVKNNRSTFNFLGEEIALFSTVGLFITMNPGYAGRTELPENLKALFRPCAMVVPDFALICEIMLVAEGFQEARVLARKFITLYNLCKELLSTQDHYDWGLRAIKSVLVVAGALKRSDRLRPEDQVLMRALRDFNIPKIVTNDVPVFMGLIRDLFPGLDVPRKRSLELEKLVKKSAIDLKLQPEEEFVLKVVQLEELFAVRHSVFVLGLAGTGKTCVWKTLNKTYHNQKRKPVLNDLNPKAVTNDELFGVINPATREWKDGLFSVIMRDQANLIGDSPKWIVLDGDIDPMWIESLNTLMDDNKVLTLASNERIALTTHMRLLFEIYNLKTATPATVSRAGILYINSTDLGWNPYVASWIDTRSNQNEKSLLMTLFDKYVPLCLDVIKNKFKKIIPIPDIAHIQMLCFLLDSLLTPENIPSDCPIDWYEIYFVFSLVWAFGSALFQDNTIDWRNEFSKWFKNEFKAVTFPGEKDVFHYYIEKETKKLFPWTELKSNFELNPNKPFQATLVSTEETVRVRYFMDLLIAAKHPVMLVGNAGSGKTAMVQEKLLSLANRFAVTNVPFNFYTTSEMLQNVLERPLEKKAGKVYGPSGSKTMIYFLDDMNMPEVDEYSTVQAHTLIRQWMDYQHWYDRHKLTLKDIHNVQFISCMNPTAGSFTINPRLQRHFCVFAISSPTPDALYQIYSSIFNQHITNPANKFPPSIYRWISPVVNAALTLHSKIAHALLPSAAKFHYVFNLRDLSNLFQGMIFATGDAITSQSSLIRLLMHESYRVYGDKLVNKKDCDTFNKLIFEVIKKSFEELDEFAIIKKPLIFCHFAEDVGNPKYFPVAEYSVLYKLLQEALSGYNDLVAAMNLVLFEDAMNHICRINRIMESPRGNALLVGVGGSGKQSLTRLAAFLSSLEVFQVQLKKGYSINDLKADIATLYVKVGLKGISTVFLMTDAQVAEESWLVIINDMLASGEISGLLADEDVENIVNIIKAEVKEAGIEGTKENCWKFYIDRCKRSLKVVLCFSPIGSTLRIRGRRFPAIINCTAIDWFHDWPKEALESVSESFLKEIKALPSNLVKSVSLFMSYVHSVVNNMSMTYLQNEKRYNYTTPKTFLEQIALYSKLLTERSGFLKRSISRLENGLLKLASTAKEADGLQDVLAQQELILTEKNAAADKLIIALGLENKKVKAEKAIATEEEERVKRIEEDVTAKAKICAEDLAKAEPALLAAREALNTLNKNNLTELKSFGTPPPAVAKVAEAVLVLFSSKGKLPKDRSWKACKIMMGKSDEFLYNLINYDKENMLPEVVKITQEYLKDPEFVPEVILGKSVAAAGLCAWVINILKFYEVFEVVEPKRKALEKANEELAEASSKLQELKHKLNILEKQLGKLKGDFEEATKVKLKCQAEADTTCLMINLAQRLGKGLGSENLRWKESVKSYKGAEITLPGDVLLASAFISYVGCFTRKYRTEMINNHWLPYLSNLQVPIPMTKSLDPIALLTDDAQIAKWNNEGLPTDGMSSENATIFTNTARWPLLIDPQLQGIRWIKNKYGSQLTVVRLSMRNYLDIIERCISNGEVILLENIGETIDAVLDTLLGRVLIKKGKAIKLGDKDVDYDTRFKLILHTKLSNPHYKPEIQAQTTLINFTVTRDGLEEQLLAEVVKAERPDLEALKSNLTKQQNNFKITLKACEDNLLERLSSAKGNILGDVALVENLEKTKKTAANIEAKVIEAISTSIKIDKAREEYRPAAIRGSLLYFVLNDLNKINAIYQFSLKAFKKVFLNAVEKALPAKILKERVANLLDSITFMVFIYSSRGLFECDKLIFMAQLTFQILLKNKEITSDELDFLLRFPAVGNITSSLDFISNSSWSSIKALAGLGDFRNLDKDIEESPNRWKKFVESECPENEKFSGEWKSKSDLQKLCILRALRPDRMTYAVKKFVEDKLGSKFVSFRSETFAKSYEETSNETPTLFILSPGVSPLKDVEELGKQLGFTFAKRNFHSVSLGQGQELVAENAMGVASERGDWVILQNIHLVVKWLPSLEKKMEQHIEDSNQSYRLYLTAEPSGDPHECVIPQGILETSIKITNEPPTGMLANLHKALDNFNQEVLEMCTKETEFKAMLFALCYFHAVVAERRKFGPQGWNRNYPFNMGDLTISVNVLYNYLETNSNIPWDDLKYLIGEIMYGGHITDDWDRRLCRTYLSEYMQPELLDGDFQYAPGFNAPPNKDYLGYHRYIDNLLPPESPHLYGLNSNAEIGFLTNTSEILFKTIMELQPRDAEVAADSSMSKEEKTRIIIDDVLDKLPEQFHIAEILAKVEERTPFVVVVCQECERINILTQEIRRTLTELDLGLKGEFTITPDMEELQESLFMNTVPASWKVKAYDSLLSLGHWLADLNVRIKELESWVGDFQMPFSVWLGGLFSPQSFLTAIMQQTARKNECALDKMCLLTDVTNKYKEDFIAAPKEGANVHGLYMEGARWDVLAGSIADSRLKELFPILPVIHIKAATEEKLDLRKMYECPVYKTRMRGSTFVWTFNLKTKEKAAKWTLAGVALLLQI